MKSVLVIPEKIVPLTYMQIHLKLRLKNTLFFKIQITASYDTILIIFQITNIAPSFMMTLKAISFYRCLYLFPVV